MRNHIVICQQCAISSMLAFDIVILLFAELGNTVVTDYTFTFLMLNSSAGAGSRA